jgi:hypothetical protein
LLQIMECRAAGTANTVLKASGYLPMPVNQVLCYITAIDGRSGQRNAVTRTTVTVSTAVQQNGRFPNHPSTHDSIQH